MLGAWPFAVAAAAVLAMLVLSRKKEATEAQGKAGLTSEGAFLFTFMLGALSGAQGVCGTTKEKVFIVASLSVVATMLLSAKPFLHDFSSKISRDDVIATVKFLLVAVVVLPLLPDEPHGPYGVLNPFKTGVMVALIAGVSFVGYAASRWLGAGRGLFLTGLVGGLASSTAVTLAGAQRAKANPELAEASALSIIAASVVMSVRVIVLAAATNRELLAGLVWPFSAMALVGAGYAALLYRRTRQQPPGGHEPALTNPFELSSALKFGAVVVAVSLVSRWAQAQFGAVALYAAGALAGLADVDAITLSIASMAARHEVEANVAMGTIFVAVAANTITKAGLSLVLGSRSLALRVALGFLAMVAAGAAGLVIKLVLARG
jgi:uncharacterized membrane protein (DUF4010 family)